MQEQTNEGVIPHPTRKRAGGYIRARIADAPSGLLHNIHHWYMVCHFLLHPDTASRSEKPFPALQRLYLQAASEVRQALPGWLNPWIPAPKCVCVVMNEGHCYKEDRHQVWIHQKEHFFLQLVDCYALGLESLLALSETQTSDPYPGREMLTLLREQVEHLKSVYAGLEYKALQALIGEWEPFEQTLLEACRRWEQQPDLGEVKRYHQDISDLRTVLWERMHMAMIHELTHAWARRKLRHSGKHWYFQTGVQYFDVEHALAHLSRPGRLYLHWAMNEAIVDWIALRIYTREPLLRWRRAVLVSGYTYWITNDIAETLHAFWERVTAATPALPRRAIRNPQELLYTIHFRDPDASTWLEQALAVACGDLHAFSLLAEACERFTLGSGAKTSVAVELLRASFTDLQRLLGPALPSSERLIPFPFWGALESEFAHRLTGPYRGDTGCSSRISLSY